MNVTAFCIKHKVTTILAFVLICIFGFANYSSLKLTMLPEVRYPAAYIVCRYSGAGPEEVEELVTRPIESVIATISGVEKIQSNSSESMSIIMVSYTKDTDMEMTAIKLREKFDQLSLPDGCIDPIIYNLNINELMPVFAFVMEGDDLAELQRMAEKEISPTIERIKGIAAVTIYGGVEKQISIATDTNRLASYHLSIPYLSQYLAGTNVLLPGGEVKSGTQTFSVSTDGTYQSVNEIANTLIPLPTGGTVRLSDVAQVYMEQKDQTDIAKANGNHCVALTVSRQSDTNEVAAAKEIKQALAQLQEDNPQFNYTVAFDSSEFILSTANNAVQNIILGVILAGIVVFMFLRRPGGTATIAVSMPFCILTVFVVMHLFHVTLNMISLGAIAMGVGMIVDNSIVVLENIYRYYANGHSRLDACIKGTHEVALPAMASTLTTICVFLPIGLSGGLAGMLFKDFSLTVSFLLLGSFVIALTLVPLMCYFLLDDNKPTSKQLQHPKAPPPWKSLFDKIMSKYLALLSFFIRKRLIAVFISIGLMVIFIASLFTTNAIFMPDVDQGEITIAVSMPAGSKMEQVAATSDKVVSLVQENCPELEYIYYTVESGSQQGANTSSIVLKLVDLNERKRSSKEVASALRTTLRDLAGCEINIQMNSMGAMMTNNESDISVQISGQDFDVLSQISSDLKKQIALLDGAVNLKSSLEHASPSVKVHMKRDNAARYGLTAGEIASAVRAELSGVTATTVTIGGKDLDVVIKGNDFASTSLDALRSMPIFTQSGSSVPLSSVATVAVELTPQTITRLNQSRQVSITGDLAGSDLTTMTKQIQTLLDTYDMPEGYSAEISGTYKEMNKSYGDLLLALLVALGLIYFVLASQFESFIMPIIVMMILPVALTGALFGLPLTGNDLSVIALIGLIMLSGVVVNSSIILVDYIKVRRNRGESKNEAIMEACPLRIRPIMMTTLTTILAMIPMALGYGDGGEMMQPMSIVMISGMIISTFITLLFTPVYYSLLDSLATRAKARFRKIKAYKRKTSST